MTESPRVDRVVRAGGVASEELTSYDAWRASLATHRARVAEGRP